MALIPSGKAFLLFEELIERLCIIAVYLDFLELREFRTIVELAELVNALIGTRSLLSELVTGEVQNLKSLGVIGLV